MLTSFFTPTPPESPTCSIIVTNVPIETTHKQIGDFFSFCGNITALSVMPSEGDESTITAVVTFVSPAAARTSVLLNNAFINKRSINVKLAPSNYEFPVPQTIREPEHDFKIENLVTHEVPAEQRTQSSVIAGLLAKGYQLSTDAFQKAREFDQQYSISRQMDAKWNTFSATVNHYDSVYHISENGEKLKETVATTYKQVDEYYDISGNMQTLGGQFNQLLGGATRTVASGFDYAAQTIGNYIQSSPRVQQKIGDMKEAGDAAYDQLTTILK